MCSASAFEAAALPEALFFAAGLRPFVPLFLGVRVAVR